MSKQIVIGVSGGSGSGKTHFCEELRKSQKENEIVIFNADRYFKKVLPKMTSPLTGGEYDDWNSPESLDYAALTHDVRMAVKEEKPIVIVEGTTIFTNDELREMMQLKIYIDTDIELRLYRRIKRNMELFKIGMEEIAGYYLEAAKFREQVYSIPSKIYADIIFNGAKEFDIPIQVMKSYLENHI